MRGRGAVRYWAARRRRWRIPVRRCRRRATQGSSARNLGHRRRAGRGTRNPCRYLDRCGRYSGTGPRRSTRSDCSGTCPESIPVAPTLMPSFGLPPRGSTRDRKASRSSDRGSRRRRAPRIVVERARHRPQTVGAAAVEVETEARDAGVVARRVLQREPQIEPVLHRVPELRTVVHRIIAADDRNGPRRRAERRQQANQRKAVTLLHFL